jgi:hypothetical protein
LVLGSNPSTPKKTFDKRANPVKLKTMKQTYDLIKNSYLVAPTYHWMLNGYAKHTELTEEDVKAYFKAKEQKEKKENATS